MADLANSDSQMVVIESDGKELDWANFISCVCLEENKIFIAGSGRIRPDSSAGGRGRGGPSDKQRSSPGQGQVPKEGLMELWIAG